MESLQLMNSKMHKTFFFFLINIVKKKNHKTPGVVYELWLISSTFFWYLEMARKQIKK